MEKLTILGALGSGVVIGWVLSNMYSTRNRSVLEKNRNRLHNIEVEQLKVDVYQLVQELAITKERLQIAQTIASPKQFSSSDSEDSEDENDTTQFVTPCKRVPSKSKSEPLMPLSSYPPVPLFDKN
tara:strand:+ start:96 stop:473 length:378 start_codon:yes stop_codon:yes gene_type:complete